MSSQRKPDLPLIVELVKFRRLPGPKAVHIVDFHGYYGKYSYKMAGNT
jgi:hypothetical protein